MTEEEYLSQRLDDQIMWYDRKAASSQQYYVRIQAMIFLCALLIPFLLILQAILPTETSRIIQVAAGMISVLLAFLVGFQSFQTLKDNSASYRATTEALKHEKFLFLARSEKYSGEFAFVELVESVEGIISREESDWTQALRTQRKEAAEP